MPPQRKAVKRYVAILNKMKEKPSEIVKAGLLVGTLDILSAFLFFYIKTGNKDVFNVLKYVASGLFGKDSSLGDTGMMWAGLLLHYTIALAFSFFMFWLFPKAKLWIYNKFITGIVYGVFIWVVMNLMVVPLSNIGNRPFNALNALINMLILIFCIGIPLSIRANSFYKKPHSALSIPRVDQSQNCR